ncbi:MAG TPA: alpha-ketoglutarate-dependent dioxygenase AlkB [Planctomycetota bacterium]|jgi:alkylated DNA repair dioxygenase AlkB|nr:alpha-ketoglutarate-dependent dioxygenase AlkB [Planctomycetota bacterium]
MSMLPFHLEREELHDLPGGGRVRFVPRYIKPEEADQQFDACMTEIPWQDRDVIVFGRVLKQPRLTAWMADEGCPYFYSQLLLEPLPWHPWVQALLPRIRKDTGFAMNSVLANLYRDGNDGVGWHADDESCFPKWPPIVSLSLGETRRFQLRHRETKETWEWHLGHGDLLVMEGPVQRNHVHQVPRTKRAIGPRINFTFRPYQKAGAPPREALA